MNTEPLVKQAHSLFSAGQYGDAKVLYQQLNARFNNNLFRANIVLCDARALKDGDSRHSAQQKTEEHAKPLDAKSQLAQTQQQLEHFFALSQNLQLRLKRQSR